MAPKAATAKSISIPRLEQVRVIATISGITPLLVNRFSERKIAELEGSQTGEGKLKKEARNPEAEFHEARHLINGKDCYPSIGIKQSMVKGGFRFAGEKGTELRGAFSIPEEYLEIINTNGGDDNWPRMRVDIVRLQGRVAMPVYRPEYWPWAMKVPIIFNSNFISMDQVVNLLRLAGFSVGIGAWRVECDGTHGQWSIADVQVEVLE